MTIEEFYHQCVRNGTEQNLICYVTPWRKCKEELPPDNMKVLIYEPSNVFKMYIATFGAYINEFVFVVNIDNYGEHYISTDKAYWMFLPEEPLGCHYGNAEDCIPENSPLLKEEPKPFFQYHSTDKRWKIIRRNNYE